MAVSLLQALRRKGMPPFSRNEAHSQRGSARPHSHWKARRTAYLAGKIISPRKSILHIFSAQAHDRFNSRPIGPKTSEKAHPSQRIPSVISAAEFLQISDVGRFGVAGLFQGGDGFGVAVSLQYTIESMSCAGARFGSRDVIAAIW